MPKIKKEKVSVPFFDRRGAEFALVSWIGAVCYCGLEILWRGWTHISMAVAGAVCFSVLYRAEGIASFRERSLAVRALIGGGVITAVEFVCGCILNLALGLDVWDYSDIPVNILGQICPKMSLLWCLLCFAVFPFCDLIGKRVFGR